MRGAEGREPVITVDGPAAAGKSTVGRRLAERLGFRFIDTGAMYRALALSVDAAGLSPDDEAKLRAHLEGVDVRLRGDRLLLDGRDVTAEIRTPRISELTSRLTRLAAVREKITPLQRRAAAAGGVVLEGRDTGTVVCPDAEVKFYMDATLDERARRRQAELRARGLEADFGTVRGEIGRRDVQDTTRALAPLRKADDAIEVDTSELTIEQVVERMLAEVERRRGCRAEGRAADGAPMSGLYAFAKPVAAALLRLFFRLEAKNPDHVPSRGPVLLVANHSSFLDPPLVGAAVSRQLWFLAKVELFRIPLFGTLIRRLNARPVRRQGPDPGALRTALRVLEAEGALLIFPEGTRGEEGVLRPAKTGAGMLAVTSGAPVVPVYISGSGRAWPRGRRFFRPARITVVFGPPLSFDGGQRAGGHRRAQYEAVGREMMAAIARLKDSLAADGARLKPRVHAQIQ